MNFDNILSNAVQDIKPSGIRKFFDIVAERPDAISLGVGEPDFVTPWHIRDAGIYSLEKGRTYYTANSGLIELRQEICNYLKRRFDIDYNTNEVLVTVGGSEAIDISLRALINPGDEVIIPEPSFVCYSPCTALAGGVPVPVETKEEDEFRLTAEALKSKITPKTKVLILPFPNNPTGAVMGRQDLEDIARVLKGTDIMVLSDEIYAELTYGEKHVSAAAIDGLKERTVLVSGFSKAFAMTGWRLGYLCAPAAFTKAVTKIHQYTIMCAPTTSQYAAVDAMRSSDADVEHMVIQYDYRRKVIMDGLRKMGLDCFEPRGAFYIFPSIKRTGLTSNEFCTKLLEEQNVAVVPGDAFGASGEGFVRISYAYSIEKINAALERIEEFMKNYR